MNIMPNPFCNNMLSSRNETNQSSLEIHSQHHQILAGLFTEYRRKSIGPVTGG